MTMGPIPSETYLQHGAHWATPCCRPPFLLPRGGLPRSTVNLRPQHSIPWFKLGYLGRSTGHPIVYVPLPVSASAGGKALHSTSSTQLHSFAWLVSSHFDPVPSVPFQFVPPLPSLNTDFESTFTFFFFSLRLPRPICRRRPYRGCFHILFA